MTSSKYLSTNCWKTFFVVSAEIEIRKNQVFLQLLLFHAAIYPKDVISFQQMELVLCLIVSLVITLVNINILPKAYISTERVRVQFRLKKRFLLSDSRFFSMTFYFWQCYSYLNVLRKSAINCFQATTRTSLNISYACVLQLISLQRLLIVLLSIYLLQI